MVFNSVHFIGFFLVVYALYRGLPHRAQNLLLLGASYYFYAAWDWRYLGLVIGSTVVDYFCARDIARHDDRGRRRVGLLLSLAYNLGMLGLFKYFNFFADNLHAVFAALGWRLDPITLRVALPIGISFYTFMTMSYVIDVYRRQIQPTRRLLDYALFVAYFPHLVAGPILRASVLIPQIVSPRTISRAQIVEGLWLVGYGYFKKVFVADNLGRVVDAIFAVGAGPTGLEVLLGLVAFAFQIYGDFSGYSDIARGVSKVMGIELTVNFRFPYFVRTPQEFWRHWHISLSEWLRDYLFLPASYALSRRLDGVRWLGLRDEAWMYAGATMVTMLLGGLWHGAAWNFVVWGAYQGALLTAFWIAGHRRGGRGRRGRRPSGPAGTLAIAGMFLLTCYGWLIFRAKSLPQVASLTSSLFEDFSPGLDALAARGLPLVFYAAPLLAIHAYEARRNDLTAVFGLPAGVRYGIYGAMLYLVVLFGDFAGAQFIYFQF